MPWLDVSAMYLGTAILVRVDARLALLPALLL